MSSFTVYLTLAQINLSKVREFTKLRSTCYDVLYIQHIQHIIFYTEVPKQNYREINQEKDKMPQQANLWFLGSYSGPNLAKSLAILIKDC